MAEHLSEDLLAAKNQRCRAWFLVCRRCNIVVRNSAVLCSFVFVCVPSFSFESVTTSVATTDADSRKGSVWIDVRTATRRTVSSPAVLVVEENVDTRARHAQALAEIGFRVETTNSAANALSIARKHALDFMLVVDHVMTEDLIEAVRGAVRMSQDGKSAHHSVIPLSEDPPVSASAHLVPRSAAERWAMLVLHACRSDGDLKTLADWAAFVGVSYSSLCVACRLFEVRPRDARDLVRVLRAIIKSTNDGVDPAVLLDVRDRRTLRTLQEKAGMLAQDTCVSVERFLNDQQFVAADNVGFIVLCRLLEASLRLARAG
jgi:CheY-like chemotaxis protein